MKPPVAPPARGGSLKAKLDLIDIDVQKHLKFLVNRVEAVRTPEALSKYIDYYIEKGFVAIDTETTGLDPLKDEIIGASMYAPGSLGIYIPFRHRSYVTGSLLNNQISVDEMSQQLQRLKDAKVKIIMHNAKFDKRFILSNFGVDLDIWWDTMLCAKVLNNLERAGLKEQYATHILGQKKTYDFEKLFKGVDFKNVPVKTATPYAAGDAIETFELYQYQEPMIKKSPGLWNIFWNIEMRVLPAVAHMEDCGIQFDTEFAKELSVKYHKMHDDAEKRVRQELKKYSNKIYEYTVKHPGKLSEPINISSPTQLAILLYDILNVGVVDKKSPRGTGVEVLEHLDNIPLAKLILELRKIDKLISTYIDKLPQVMNPKDGRIHCSYNQIGADCVVGDTYVVTPEGIKQIQDIVGYCRDGVYQEFTTSVINEYNEVEETSHKIMFEDVETIRIETTYGLKLEGTPNHPIRVLNRNISSFRRNKSQKVMRELWDNITWKQLKDIQHNDLILVDATPYSFSQPYIETHFDQTIHGKTHKRSSKMPELFDGDFAELLGMYHSDGALQKNNGSWTLTLYNDHPEAIVRWTDLCEKLFDLTPKRTDSNMSYVAGYAIRSPKLQQLLRYVHTGKRNKRIPQVILDSNDTVFYSYLRGCSLDSGYDGAESLTYHFINESDCRAVQQRLLKQGIVASVRVAKKFGDDCSITILKEGFDHFISLTGKLFRKSPVKDIPADKSSWNKSYQKGNWIAVPVKKICITRNTVYDFTLPRTHSFQTGGFVSHNTGRFSSQDPNLQNIPSHNKEIRQMFVAKPGHILLSCDYS